MARISSRTFRVGPVTFGIEVDGGERAFSGLAALDGRRVDADTNHRILLVKDNGFAPPNRSLRTHHNSSRGTSVYQQGHTTYYMSPAFCVSVSTADAAAELHYVHLDEDTLWELRLLVRWLFKTLCGRADYTYLPGQFVRAGQSSLLVAGHRECGIIDVTDELEREGATSYGHTVAVDSDLEQIVSLPFNVVSGRPEDRPLQEDSQSFPGPSRIVLATSWNDPNSQLRPLPRDEGIRKLSALNRRAYEYFSEDQVEDHEKRYFDILPEDVFFELYVGLDRSKLNNTLAQFLART
ncbi:MAG: hypothetical protein P8R42_08490 [Candidatus Binatia bacterium]|nr:hypothetical protein [Candidatus Binatia bacterium]